MSRDVLPGAADRMVALVTRLAQDRWEEAACDFDDRMRERVGARRLAAGWAQTVGMIGSSERMGEPFAHRAAMPATWSRGMATACSARDRGGSCVLAGMLRLRRAQARRQTRSVCLFVSGRCRALATSR